ncbi:hypothetical protein MA16_Dca009664 [Dendrobium catenatum]|uniref:Uncharacterized protein n=1 Tax=Dendrobium catenatum TaxID=906689 RepID=A0A2I0VSP2_9ASPA|nr:hypothetical protein MA16_Dca009664 [Dendrobium catenatum]
MGMLIDLWVGMGGYSIWWINPQGDHPAHLRGEVRAPAHPCHYDDARPDHEDAFAWVGHQC